MLVYLYRPDYRRIVRVLQALPRNVPVLATTATANNRVVGDVISQLGKDIHLVRGPLVRESLKLQNITMKSPAARMAWLAHTIPSLPGSGIVYTLTQRDAERVAEWLKINKIKAKAYHADVADNEDGVSLREKLEQQLLNNEIKVLVATVALGMGFDKPDLGFVIHFQRPELVPDFARRLAGALGLPFHACIQKAKANPPQKKMQNSFQQAHNLDGVFAMEPGTVSAGTCLLIDDMTDSGWTFTAAAAILRRAGCTAVFPLALALNSPRMD